MFFREVGLSTSSVPTLCLKAPQTEDDTIYPEILLTVELARWNKLPGFGQLKDKENLPLGGNNDLLKLLL